MEVEDIVEQNRNYVLATCTALGGYEERETAPGKIEKVYTLGDEALGCLKDLKRAVRAESQSSQKTFLPALTEFNVLESDLIPIIKLHADDDSEVAHRFILACVELIVPMTWPLAGAYDDDEDYDPNLLSHYRKHKLALLAPGILEAVTRLLTGPLSTPYRERSIYDQTVIRLVLYFFRNLTAIPDLNASPDATEETVRMASMQEDLVIRFCETNIMELLLVIASNSNEPDASEWNVIVLEIFYNLLRNASAKDVFLSDLLESESENNTDMLSDKLSNLLKDEHTVKRQKLRSAPSRHNRFGGSYAIKAWDGHTQVFHKQQAAYGDLTDIMDSKKKEDRRGQKRKEKDEIGVHATYKTSASLRHLKQTARSFLQDAFNTFYSSLIRDIEREDKKIEEKDHVRFMYTIKWFLEYIGYEQAAYEKAKKKEKEKEKGKVVSGDQLLLPSRNNGGEGATTEEKEEDVQMQEQQQPFDFDLIACVVDLRAILLCLRRMRLALDDKLWLDVQVAADCFRQMLLTVTEMAASPHEEYRDVADYIQSNIYHEQSTLDLFIDLIRRYKSQSYGYIESIVHLTHAMLKLLEEYSHKHKFMFVRRKKKTNSKKKTAEEDQQGPASDENMSEDSDEEDQEREYREHLFKFEAFEKRFLNYDVVRVYCTLLEHYETLKPETIYCIASMFHRIMVKRKVEQVFWKLPILDLFNRILSQATSLPRNPAMMELIQFIRYCTRQFFKRLDEYPLLLVETLFVNVKPRAKDHDE